MSSPAECADKKPETGLCLLGKGNAFAGAARAKETRNWATLAGNCNVLNAPTGSQMAIARTRNHKLGYAKGNVFAGGA